MLALFLKGLIMGFAIAAPVGPIGVLCIQRSLYNGFKAGLVTGMGAALADGTYGLIAGLGLTVISSLLITYQFWIRVIGGLFLMYLGIKLILTASHNRLAADCSNQSLWNACSTTYLLTLMSPATILSFIAIFAGLGLGTVHTGFLQTMLLVAGIILGSAAWWLLLSGGVAWILHKRINSSYMRMINWIAGSIILLSGLLAIH